MVKIRLARGGAKKRPFYHIVVTDQRQARDGRYIERLGFYNPVAIGGEVPLRLDIERVDYWKERGAQVSERVMNLVKSFTKHGEGVAAERAAPPVSKAKEAPAQAVPADATGDVSGEDAEKAATETPETAAPEEAELKPEAAATNEAPSEKTEGAAK